MPDLTTSIEMLKRLEWSAYSECEGTSMSDPLPMHPTGHPACPLCGGQTHEGETGGEVCFNESAYGHKRNCKLADLIAELEKER